MDCCKNNKFQGDFWAPLPYLTMCLLAFVEVVAFLCIVPETKGKAMPDRMPESEEAVVRAAKPLIKLNKLKDEHVRLNEMQK